MNLLSYIINSYDPLWLALLVLVIILIIYFGHQYT
jgi:hypothetical protein